MKKLALTILTVVSLAALVIIASNSLTSEPASTVSIAPIQPNSGIPPNSQSTIQSAEPTATAPQPTALLRPYAYNDNITPKSRRSKAAVSRHRQRLIKAFSAKGLRFGAPVFIRLFKASRELEIWVKKTNQPAFKHFKTYRIAAFSGKLGPKFAEGDWQAPEGFYFVPASRLNPNSRFHLSFNLGYPNAYDRAHHRTGSALMVHGNRVSTGCYAMTDKQIEEIYSIVDAALSAGQPFFRVHIFPFRLTEDNLAAHRQSKHWAFWNNLRQGYEQFEKTKIPPNVSVKNKRYAFNEGTP